MEKAISEKMDKFLAELDALCRKHRVEIHPTEEGWTGRVNEKGELDTFSVLGYDGEVVKLTYIDGDGRGK